MTSLGRQGKALRTTARTRCASTGIHTVHTNVSSFRTRSRIRTHIQYTASPPSAHPPSSLPTPPSLGGDGKKRKAWVSTLLLAGRVAPCVGLSTVLGLREGMDLTPKKDKVNIIALLIVPRSIQVSLVSVPPSRRPAMSSPDSWRGLASRLEVGPDRDCLSGKTYPPAPG